MKSHPFDHRLRAYSLWLRTAWPLGLAAAGLAVTLGLVWRQHPTLGILTHNRGLLLWWGGGLLFTLIVSLTASVYGRRSLLEHARQSDRRFVAKNRLEAAAELRHDTGTLAQAQREETDAYLVQTSSMRPHRQPLYALASLVILLVLCHAVLWVTWIRPWSAVPSEKKAESFALLPTASIQWKSPEPETQAASVEEVPLEASATSSTGLNDLMLEVEVNGVPRASNPITEDELRKAGTHVLQISLYLDQYELEPYDIVSYYLRARRMDPRKLPETVSPVQFVQIKPFREDVKEQPGGDGSPSYALIKALKVAQLRLLKENFLLAHANLTETDPVWKKENERVGGDQSLLVEKTSEALQKLIAGGMPAEIIDLITQAQTDMKAAAQEIQTKRNQEALTPQGKALALLTEIEKFFVKTISKEGKSKGSAKEVKDPFDREKKLELKQRFKTKSAELELIAAEQQRLSEDLTHPKAAPSPTPAADEKPDPNILSGTLDERQTQISQRAGTLVNGVNFPGEVLELIEKGRSLAQESLRQLDASDLPAALEPATSAAREFHLAVEAMNRLGEQQAKNELAKALGKLAQAAEKARKAPDQKTDEAAKQQADAVASTTKEAEQELAEGAQQQQETGSEKAAKQLMETAKALSNPELQQALDHLKETPRDQAIAQDVAGRLQEIASQSVRNANASQALTREQLTRLIERLERDRANLHHLAEQGTTTDSLQKSSGTGSEKAPGQGSEEGQQQEGKSDSSSSGVGSSSDPGKTGKATPAAMHAAETTAQEKFARELVEDFRSDLMEVAEDVPKDERTVKVQKTLQETCSSERPNWSVIHRTVESDLNGIISMLRQQLELSQRSYRLNDQELELAPAAYRGAVSDYFEQLSKTYDKAQQTNGEGAPQ